jgi:hypothetical protein
MERTTPAQIVEENFKGLDDLIKDKDLLSFYKSLIETCLIEFSEQEQELSVDKVLTEVVNNMEWSNCYDGACHCNIDAHEKNILSLKPQILEELRNG